MRSRVQGLLPRNVARRRFVDRRKERAMEEDRSERGRRAGFDPVSGKVHGSGSGAGGGNPGEDHDADPQAGGGADPVQSPEEAVEHDPAEPLEERHG
jgi:hypothetical protein